eukprot:212471-Chlamydomonas_euryale.AAC.1
MFEDAMRDCLPHLLDEDPQLLHRLITMVSPNELRARGVPLYRCGRVEGVGGRVSLACSCAVGGGEDVSLERRSTGVEGERVWIGVRRRVRQQMDSRCNQEERSACGRSRRCAERVGWCAERVGWEGQGRCNPTHSTLSPALPALPPRKSAPSKKMHVHIAAAT